ncbi:unnamed protein product [Adineta steineri]|uniref:PAS domain-containing protein n=2 Tax=Adineta steineri TaxID=433720 RepID=A0A818LC11_9BILA|nr:unnamed protein product [Adineta steineri]CAF1451315.1 unnamed protein product [Adineta steineri]CAF3563893.1 unnamed protein product [Adineta steineri]CAF3729327.1 unnamed protein product [Adineta steineri]
MEILVTDVTKPTQQRQQNRLSFEEMGNVLLDAMQGTLVCIDNHHIIVDVSKTVKHYFGFEQSELIGLSILLLVEDSERESFIKFLNSSPQPNDICCVRMMMNSINEYRQVKIQRKKKLNQDNVDVHSTTQRYSCSIETILIIMLEDSSYIDITLYDIHKQEFYTKMNLIGEIIFEDHRGALITGYLPHEIFSRSIFNFVYHEDRLVKLHALWKCVTTGSSKLQWRLNARDGSLVFLQTEYKLISDNKNHDIIVARNEVLSPVQISQFDELQTAWKHQCAADIKGNSSSFRIISSSDNDSSSMSNGECRICVPSLNMCFTTNKLQPLNLQGNIFDVSKFARPLTIQDYVHILIDNDKHMDSELANIVNNIQSLTARYRRLNDVDKSQRDTTDITTEEKFQSESSSPLTDTSLRRKHDSDSIVRGILSNSMKYDHENASGDSSTTIARLLNGNGNTVQNGNTRSSTTISRTQTNQSKSDSTSTNPENPHLQHVEFLKKYKAAKAKLESQLESFRNQDTINGNQPNDLARRNTILNKLSQLETIKSKHLARRHDGKRQTTTTAVAVNNVEQKDFLTSLFSSPNSSGLLPMDNTSRSNSSPLSSTNDQLSSYTSNYQHQRNSSQQFDPGQSPSYPDVKNSLLDELLTPSSPYIPVNNNPSASLHSYMNVSYQRAPNDSPSASSITNHHQHHHNTTYRY